jgi:hypothetical protein
MPFDWREAIRCLLLACGAAVVMDHRGVRTLVSGSFENFAFDVVFGLARDYAVTTHLQNGLAPFDESI